MNEMSIWSDDDRYIVVPTCPKCHRILLDGETACPDCGRVFKDAEEWIFPEKLERTPYWRWKQ